MVSIRKNGVRWLLGLALVTATPSVQADSTALKGDVLNDLPAASLIYVSDYFSFVGQDSQGKVAFAIDNSRGRDGDTYQAQHLLVLHDEKAGWARLNGNSQYENSGKELKTIPDSPFFRFEGTPTIGMTIISESNHLTLNIKPIIQRMSKRHDGAMIVMGTASAVLMWKGRTIPGAVICEYFMMPDFNRLTRTSWDLLREYQGFYLKIGTDSDVYLHRQHSERLVPLMGVADGLTVFSGVTDSMKDLNIEVLGHGLARGLYRWPTAWRMTWTGSQGPAVLSLKQVTRTGIWNWGIGGFSMAVVDGELDYAGKKQPVYGLAELIM